MPARNKVLITGSSGMLGVDLSQELRGDYDVNGLDIVNSSHLAADSFNKCDITRKEEVDQIIEKAGPDVVVHTAAWADVDGCETDKDRAYKINAEGTGNVALVCKKIDAVLIYISTDFVFDGKKGSPYREADKTNPLNVYGESKLKGEAFIRDTLEKYFIIRTSWLYGRNGKNFVDTILTKAQSEKILKVVDDQTGSPTYTKDLAGAIHALLDKFFSLYAGYGIYHVSNSGSVSWFEYAEEILKAARIHAGACPRTRIVPISSAELARPAKRPAMSVMDNSKFVKFTGYASRHWKTALADYLDNKN